MTNTIALIEEKINKLKADERQTEWTLKLSSKNTDEDILIALDIRLKVFKLRISDLEEILKSLQQETK